MPPLHLKIHRKSKSKSFHLPQKNRPSMVKSMKSALKAPKFTHKIYNQAWFQYLSCVKITAGIMEYAGREFAIVNQVSLQLINLKF